MVRMVSNWARITVLSCPGDWDYRLWDQNQLKIQQSKRLWDQKKISDQGQITIIGIKNLKTSLSMTLVDQ